MPWIGLGVLKGKSAERRRRKNSNSIFAEGKNRGKKPVFALPSQSAIGRLNLDRFESFLRVKQNLEPSEDDSRFWYSAANHIRTHIFFFFSCFDVVQGDGFRAILEIEGQ